jgi:hypothetical protein
MAEQTFTAGQVLTAAQMTTLQTNTGLNYITSGALSGTSTNFAGCFTSAYTNYRIVIETFTSSGAVSLYARMLNGTTPVTTAVYDFAYRGLYSNNTSADNSGSGQTLFFTGIGQVGNYGSPYAAGTMDIINPQTTQRTIAQSQTSFYESNFGSRVGMAEVNTTTSYDGIQFLSGSAVTMTGTVTIYGYRK